MGNRSTRCIEGDAAERKVSRSEQVRKVLEEFGPMTAHDIAEELGVTQKEVSLSINSMRRQNNRLGILHISGWVRTWEGIQPRPRAVWALGNKRDARPPERIPQVEICRQWRARKQVKVTSVFDWMRART